MALMITGFTAFLAIVSLFIPATSFPKHALEEEVLRALIKNIQVEKPLQRETLHPRPG